MSTTKSKLRNIRNIVQSPFHIQWSEKKAEEIRPLQNALKELLPAAKLEKRTLNKKLIIARKNFKGVNEVSSKVKQLNVLRSYLTPGFQTVIRGLKKKELSCVVMSTDMKPILLQKAIFGYAQTDNVPVVVIPDLKSITQTALGFAAMVLGFKSIVAKSQENRFHQIYRMVKHNPTLYKTPFHLNPRECVEPVECSKERKNELVPLQIQTENPYLYRETVDQRTFTPVFNTIINSHTIKRKNDEYISLEINPQQKVSIDKTKAPTTSYEEYYDDDDDDDDEDDDNSGKDNLFFVDNNPNKMLLDQVLEEDKQKSISTPITKNLHKKSPLSKSKSNELPSAKQSMLSKPMQQVKSTEVNHSKVYGKKAKKKNRNAHGHSTEIHFKSLQIKTVNSNPKRNRAKKRKHISL